MTTEQQNSVRFQTVKQYFEYLQHRTVIRFRQRDIPKVDAFSLTLHLKMTYEDVAKVFERPPTPLQNQPNCLPRKFDGRLWESTSRWTR